MRRHSSPGMADSRFLQRGYALLLMLIVLIMGSLYSVVSQLSKVGSDAARGAGTQNALKQAKEALIAYATTYRDDPTHSDQVFGYLPCPDTDGDGYAQSSCGSKNVTAVGLLPYRTLGLMELRDAEGNCLWYAVSGNYKNNPKTDTLNWDTRGKIKVMDADGTTVLTDPSIDGDSQGGGVAIVFSPGSPLSTQSGRSTADTVSCGINSVSSSDSYLESAAFDSSGYSSANPLVVTQGKRVNAQETTVSTNNDQIAWLSAKSLWDQFRKRSDKGSLNDLTTAIKDELDGDLISDFVGAASSSPAPSTLPLNATEYATPASAYSGYVGELPDVSAAIDTDLTSYFSNWKEQYRYVACKNLCGYCLTVGGQQCNGAVFFGGTDTTGAPRAAGARSIANLFEDADAKPLLLGTSATFSGASTYASGSTDVGVCLAPKSTVEAQYFIAACNAGSLNTVSSVSTRPATSVNTATGTITLGYSGSGSTSGCVWTANTYAFGSGLRAYFQVDMVVMASGVTFAIIDSDRQSSTTPCGGVGANLGYSGDAGATPIAQPKMALELDTANSGSDWGDTTNNHAALVYWGSNSSIYDDNKHGATASSGFHSNPASGSSAVSSDLSSMFSNGTFHVRMDITRSYSSATSQGTYTVKVWLVSNSDASAAQRSDLRDINQAFTSTTTGSGSLPSYIKYLSDGSFTLNNYVSGQETFKNIRLGFTTGQIAASSQLISGLVVNVLP